MRRVESLSIRKEYLVTGSKNLSARVPKAHSIGGLSVWQRCRVELQRKMDVISVDVCVGVISITVLRVHL
jgi:hypothetical protein